MAKKVVISQSIMWAAAILVVSIVEEKEFAVLMLVLLEKKNFSLMKKLCTASINFVMVSKLTFGELTKWLLIRF